MIKKQTNKKHIYFSNWLLKKVSIKECDPNTWNIENKCEKAEISYGTVMSGLDLFRWL